MNSQADWDDAPTVNPDSLRGDLMTAPVPTAATPFWETFPATPAPSTAPSAVIVGEPVPMPKPTPPSKITPSPRPAGGPLPPVPTGKSKRKKARAVSATIKPGFRLASSDLEIIDLLSRYRYATRKQVSEYSGRSLSALANRLPALEDAGLLNVFEVRGSRTLLYSPTAAGLEAANHDLAPVQVLSYQVIRHTLGLVQVGIEMESGGELVVTEREIRAAASRSAPRRGKSGKFKFGATPRIAAELPRMASDPNADAPDLFEAVFTVPWVSAARQATVNDVLRAKHKNAHIPDMVLLRRPFEDGRHGHVAVELELSRKTPADYEDILASYAASQYGHVAYFTDDNSVANMLRKAAKKTPGLHRRLKVQLVGPLMETVDQQIERRPRKRRRTAQ